MMRDFRQSKYDALTTRLVGQPLNDARLQAVKVRNSNHSASGAAPNDVRLQAVKE